MHEDSSVIDVLKALVPGNNLLGNDFKGRIHYSPLPASCLQLGIDVVFQTQISLILNRDKHSRWSR